MTEIEPNGGPSCGGGCGECGGAAPSGDEVLTGWRFGLSAAATFLAPLALAIVGAVLNGPSGCGELVGGVCGLAIGAAAVVAGSRILCLGRRSSQST